MKTRRKVDCTMNKEIQMLFIRVLLVAVPCLLFMIGCSSSDEPQGIDPNPTPATTIGGTVAGIVTDENGSPYPNTLITVSKGTEEISRATNADGMYSVNTKDVGSYNISMTAPLSTKLLGNMPVTVNIQADETSTADFVIEPQPVVAHLNFGNVQLLEEIKDKDGNTPTNPNEPLYAANIFDAPLGLLTPIKAPDGHQITLAEYKMAKGSLKVYCNGNSAIVEIALEGMIPNGTYTFWLAYLKKKRKVGEPINFMNDFVHPTNPPIGSRSGTENILIAGADGAINATLEHTSCVLTDEVALVIPILYHINGKTFGGGHVPDPEEVVQMLAYFQ